MENNKQFYIFRKRICSFLNQRIELFSMAKVKLFTANTCYNFWFDSDLEGTLCYFINYDKKAPFVALYSSKKYIKLFEMQLYRNFSEHFLQLREDFYCFEVDSGFIGLQFERVVEANLFYLTIRKFNDELIKRLVDNYMDKEILESTQEKEERFLINCQIIQHKFEERLFSKKKLNADYLEDRLEIKIPKTFDILETMVYDHVNKLFTLKKTPSYLKKIFKNIGLKKSHFNNTVLVLNLAKHLIEEYDVVDSLRRETCWDFDEARLTHKLKRETDASENSSKKESLVSNQEYEIAFVNQSKLSSGTIGWKTEESEVTPSKKSENFNEYTKFFEEKVAANAMKHRSSIRPLDIVSEIGEQCHLQKPKTFALRKTKSLNNIEPEDIIYDNKVRENALGSVSKRKIATDTFGETTNVKDGINMLESFLSERTMIRKNDSIHEVIVSIKEQGKELNRLKKEAESEENKTISIIKKESSAKTDSLSASLSVEEDKSKDNPKSTELGVKIDQVKTNATIVHEEAQETKDKKEKKSDSVYVSNVENRWNGNNKASDEIRNFKFRKVEINSSFPQKTENTTSNNTNKFPLIKLTSSQWVSEKFNSSEPSPNPKQENSLKSINPLIAQLKPIPKKQEEVNLQVTNQTSNTSTSKSKASLTSREAKTKSGVLEDDENWLD